MKKIVCKIERCLACKSCELACALANSKSQNFIYVFRESKQRQARIKVEFIDENGSLSRTRAIAIQCRQCKEPVCVQACISGGIQRDKTTGNIVIDSLKCVACWSCIMVCPFGAILIDKVNNCAIKCDQCEDREVPICIVSCPTGALELCDADEFENNECKS